MLHYSRLFNTITLFLLFGSISFLSVNCEDEYFGNAATALNKTLNFVLFNNTFLNVDGMLGLNTAQVTSQNDEMELLSRTVGALDKTFDFVLNDSIPLNVDGLLGFNTAYGHLKKALSKATNGSTVQILAALLDKAKLISDLETPLLPNFPYKYYVFNNYVIPSELWERDINFTYGRLNPNPNVYPGPHKVNNIAGYLEYVTTSDFSEKFSDSCYVEVATATDDIQPHDCPVNNACAEYMLTMPTEYSSRFPGYGVTHMAIFLQIARNRNCNFDYDKVNALLEEECSYILWELKKNVQYGYISNLDDVFIEQIDVCGLEGFAEFLKKDYLKHILRIQLPDGGFRVKYLNKTQWLNRNRPKRESVEMKHGASSHTTGLAASALSLFIRVLIEKPFSNKAFYEDL